MNRFFWVSLLLSVAACSTGNEPQPKIRLPEIPWLAQKAVASKPPAPDRTASKLSISAQNIPLSQLLFHLADKAGISLKIDLSLEQKVSVTIEDQSLRSVVNQLALRHGFIVLWSRDSLHIKANEAYFKSYPVPILAIARTLRSDIAIASREISALQTTDSATAKIETIAESSSWSVMQTTVEAIAEAGVVIAQPTAGLLVVKATQPQHLSIEHYLHALQQASARQVLIEAAVVEVRLSSQHKLGVDWRSLATGDGWSASQNNGNSGLESLAPANTFVYKATQSARALEAALQALAQFGEVQVLSNPRIHAMQHQAAVLKVIDEHVYFTQSSRETLDENGEPNSRNITTTLGRVPVGLTLSVLASIDQNDAITLLLRPSLSRVKALRSIPSTSAKDGIELANEIPELQIRELETVVSVPSGSMIMLGGLIASDRESNSDQIPLLGSAFGRNGLLGSRVNSQQRNELAIFIRPTVIHHEHQ